MMMCIVVESHGVKEHLRLLAAFNDIYCKKFQVALVPSKTMLLVNYTHSQASDIELANLVSLFLF